MVSFSVGEEVIFQGKRYVISTASPRQPYQYRLLATTPEGARVAWAMRSDLGKMENYTTPNDDTSDIKGSGPTTARRR